MDPIVKSIPISQILPSPYQARKEFDMEHLRGLAESMKQEGLLNPVVVRKTPAGYELISGERRMRAAKLLGWPSLEAKIIGTVSEAEAAAKGLIENIQRENLNTIEEAEGYLELNKLDPKYWNQSKIAQNCGKTQGHVSEFLRFLTLPDGVKEYIRRRILTAGHAAELIRIPKLADQKAMAQKIVKGKWSVMQTREAVEKKLGKRGSQKPAAGSKLNLKNTPSAKPDPLAEVWKTVRQNPRHIPLGTWDVVYGPAGADNDGWTFVVPNPGDLSASDLAKWFRRMAEAIEPEPAPPKNSDKKVEKPELQNGHEEPAAPEVKAPEALRETPRETPAKSPMLLPENPNELRIMARERDNLRLPKNQQEEAELEALGAQGLLAVYKWIYGEDSLTAKKVSEKTWAEWGVSDPITGVKGIVKALRRIQELSKT